MLRYVRSINPAVLFRILLALALALQILQLLRFQDVLFSQTPQIAMVPLNVLLYLHLAILLSLAIGLHRSFAFLNYVFVVLLLGYFLPKRDLGYHADGFLIAGSFVLLFLRITPVWRREFEPAQDTRYVGILILCFIAAAYVDSSVIKLSSRLWVNGLGYWVPASYPFISTGTFPFFLDNEVISRLLGYSVLGFEMLFPILAALRPIRAFVICAGVLFHLGIGLIYPIPLFGLTMIALYCGAALALGASTERLRIFQWNAPRKMIRFAIVFVCFAGTLFVLVPPPINSSRKVWNSISAPLLSKLHLLYPFLGMSHHEIFIDGHFGSGRWEKRYRLQADSLLVELPLTGEEIQTGNYTSDRLHSYWFFAVSQESRLALVRKFAQHLYWQVTGSQQLIPIGATITSEKRWVSVPIDRWEPGVRARNEQSPWTMDTVVSAAE